MPGWMCVPRKPHPFGQEAKNGCCGETGIMICFEIYEGKDRMKLKKFVAEYGATCAQTLRLVEPWAATGRCVVADSWFGSVNSAIALLTMFCLFSILCVKTAHKYFPKDKLLGKMKNRGNTFVINGKVNFQGEALQVNAVAHMDKQPLLLVATCGTTLPGNPALRRRAHLGVDGTYQVVEYKLEQPEISGIYRKYFNKIDVHNHIRHTTPSFSDVWGTRQWWVRDFAEMLGFIQTNALLAWNYFSKEGKANPLTFKTFQKKLAARLVNNPFITPADHALCVGKRVGEGDSDSDSDDDGDAAAVNHHLSVIRGGSDRLKPRQLGCSVCGMKCSHFCSCGGDDDESPKVKLCAPTTTGRDCYERHACNGTPLGKERKRRRDTV